VQQVVDQPVARLIQVLRAAPAQVVVQVMPELLTLVILADQLNMAAQVVVAQPAATALLEMVEVLFMAPEVVAPEAALTVVTLLGTLDLAV
jgi:hypothetical protein